MLRNKTWNSALAVGLGLSPWGYAQNYADLATISATMGVNNTRVCIGEGTRSDIGCPTYAPTVSAAGLLTATSFATGGLTVSGATSLSTVSATVGAFNSLTVNGVPITGSGGGGTPGGVSGSLQFNSGGAFFGRSDLFVDASGNVLTRLNMYAGGGGVGYSALMRGDATNAGYVGFHLPNDSRLGYIGYGTAAAGMNVWVDQNGPINFGTNGNTRMVIAADGRVGIGTSSPQSALHVPAGEVQVANSSAACSGSNAGAIRYTGGALSFCNGTAWTALATGTLGNYVLKAGDTMTGELLFNTSAPTIRLVDTDQRSGMIHQNANLMYFLSGAGVNDSNWSSNGTYWPLTLNMTNDTATFGGDVTLPEGDLVIGNVTTNPDAIITQNKANGSYAYTRYATNGAARWDMGADNGNETGSNAGSNFFINRFNDAGSYLNSPFTINRASGEIGLNANVSLGGLLVTAPTAANFPGDGSARNTIEITGSASMPALMSFHRPGAYAAYFGIGTDNNWRVGGWSMGATSYRIWHEGNFAPGNYVAKSGDTMSGNLVLNDGSNGRVGLDRGSGGNPGYVYFTTPDGVRRGYVGWQFGTNRIGIMGENGWGFNFNITPQVNGVPVTVGSTCGAYPHMAVWSNGGCTPTFYQCRNGSTLTLLTLGNQCSIGSGGGGGGDAN